MKDRTAGEPIDGDRARAGFWGREGHRAVLVLTLFTVIVVPLVDRFVWGPVVSAGLVGIIALLALARSGAHRRIRHAGAVISVAAVVVSSVAPLLGGAKHNRTVAAVTTGALALLLLVAILAILRHVGTHQRVTVASVGAAISAYLLFGLMFALIFRCIDVVQGGDFFAETAHPSAFAFEYFSYVTLTTLGYGDFTPATDAGRAAVVFEALIGQVFLVTIVALVVSNLGRERPPRARK